MVTHAICAEQFLDLNRAIKGRGKQERTWGEMGSGRNLFLTRKSARRREIRSAIELNSCVNTILNFSTSLLYKVWLKIYIDSWRPGREEASQ